MAINSFHFKLKKVSSREQRLIGALYEYLPATGLRSEFEHGIKEAISRHVGEEFSFRLEALQYEDYSVFLSKLPKPAVMAVVGMAPLAHKAILEIDISIAMLAVERILGGEIISMPEPRPLSDTEQGVLQYLILQMLAHVHRVSGKDARVHFRFDRFAFGADEVSNYAGDKNGVAVLVFRVNLGRHSGFIRLCLPDPFIEESLLKVEAENELRSGERAWRLKLLDRFNYVKIPLLAEAGSSTLLPADLMELEEGDVILFDKSTVSVEQGKPCGKVVLKLGDGMHGGIDAELTIDGQRAHCRITGVHKGE